MAMRMIGICLGLCLAAAATGDVFAQQVRCAEGRAMNGKCVNPALAGSMRLTSVIYSQPKISQTAFPVLPVQDFEYRYPHSLIPNPLRPAPAFSLSP
jgi:hypothetical protein